VRDARGILAALTVVLITDDRLASLVWIQLEPITTTMQRLVVVHALIAR